MKLQMQAMDVLNAYKNVNTVVSSLKSLRRNFTNEFKKIFNEVTKLGRQLHGETYELTTPRVTGHHNSWTSIPEDYF